MNNKDNPICVTLMSQALLHKYFSRQGDSFQKTFKWQNKYFFILLYYYVNNMKKIGLQA